ncbi:hypothetical protein [Nocardia thailandica]
MSTTILPVHPVTGLRAIGYTRRGPIWPVRGGSVDAGAPAGDSTADSGADRDAETGDQQPAETVEHWKKQAREWEKRAKENVSAATELASLKESQMTETEKLNARLKQAEAEAASVPAKVAEALKQHLVDTSQIDKETADLYLTATDPELLLKQAAGLAGLGAGGGRNKRNRVDAEGRSGAGKTTKGGDGTAELEEFTRQLFRNDD